MEYRPALADLPDHKGWRIKPEGGYGLLDTFVRGLIELNEIYRYYRLVRSGWGGQPPGLPIALFP